MRTGPAWSCATAAEPAPTEFWSSSRPRPRDSPNDLVFRSDGDLTFTDPPFGLPGTFADPEKELSFQGVFRLTQQGELSAIITELGAPNGLGFSPDETILYVSNAERERPIWMAYPVLAGWNLAGSRLVRRDEPMVTPARPLTTSRVAATAPLAIGRDRRSALAHVAELGERYRRLWFEVPSELSELGPLRDPGACPCSGPRPENTASGRNDTHRFCPLAERRANAQHCQALVDRIAELLLRFPRKASRTELEQGLRATVDELTTSVLGWSESERRLLLSEELFSVTRDFARRARLLSPTLQPDALFQGLRNLWIMNAMQMLLGRPVALTPAAFAYSLLYPLTDNPLDSGALERAAKLEVSARLSARLAGEPLAPANGHEATVFHLLDLIDEQFPRRAFPEVHQALLAIHAAQTASLGQQQPAGPPGEIDLLGLSIAKGGSSVLADAYLVAGRLADAHADFFFGYGVALQLLDDLQDAASDLAAGHLTVFSQSAAGGWPLDSLASRLARFVASILDEGESRFPGRSAATLWAAIRKNCTLLWLGAVAEQPRLFTRAYSRRVEQRSLLDFAAWRRLKRRARRRHEAVAREWRRQGVDASALEVL